MRERKTHTQRDKQTLREIDKSNLPFNNDNNKNGSLIAFKSLVIPVIYTITRYIYTITRYNYLESKLLGHNFTTWAKPKNGTLVPFPLEESVS